MKSTQSVEMTLQSEDKKKKVDFKERKQSLVER